MSKHAHSGLAGLQARPNPPRAPSDKRISMKEIMDMVLSISTAILTIATVLMAYETFLMVKESREASYRQIGVQTWLEFEKRFDSTEMVQARRKLATQLRSPVPVPVSEISDTVPNFFEDLGTVYKTGYIDKKLMISSFSYFTTRYWEALKPYVAQERRQHGGDQTISEDFEFLARETLQKSEKIDERDLRRFLEEESHIAAD